MTSTIKSAVAGILLAAAALAHAADARLGLGIQVDGDGPFWNPVVNKVMVSSVEPRSLAANAGIVAGDEITSIEGRAVKGRPASELKPYISFGAGETRTFTVKHANGESFDARISKPKE